MSSLGAIRLSPITDVVVLSPDPLFPGVEQVRHLTPFLDRAWPTITERSVDEWSVLGLLFPTHIGLIGLATTVEPIEDVAAILWDRLGECIDEVTALAAHQGGAPA